MFYFIPSQDLLNIFESFLPQLLRYPNPVDPLNGDAAALYLQKPEDYKRKIKDYVSKYATEDAIKEINGPDPDNSGAESSSLSEFSSGDEDDVLAPPGSGLEL
ncbi:unnamed protein product [Gordionus sp. m RMFG-2023]